MKRRRLGGTGLYVSPIGFGSWQLGGSGWGAFSEEEALRAVRRALDLGINLFDTAPVYGFGRSEEFLAKALGSARKSAVIVSKGGLVWDDRGRVAHDNRPESLRRGLEGTLKRLGREVLDVFLLHWPDPKVPLEESALALDSLRREGKIKAWGVSNFPAVDVLEARWEIGNSGSRLRSDKDRASIVLEYPLNALEEYAAEYAASAEAGRELLKVVQHEDGGFLAFDVLARGLLGGRYGPRTRFGKRDLRSRDARFQGEAFLRNLERVERMSAEACSLGLSPAAFAMRQVLDRPGVTAAIIGMKTAAQVEESSHYTDTAQE